MSRRVPLPRRSPRPTVPRLVAIVDEPTCRARDVDPLAAAGLAADAGAPAVLLRARETAGAELHHLADQVARFCRHGGALSLISSDVEVATAVRADGVHLPSSLIDRAPGAVDAGLLVGASVHDHAELVRALDAGVHYVLASPVYAPSSKPTERPPLGIDRLAALCRSAAPVPVLALGGLTPDRIVEVRRAGAYGVAALGPFSATGVARSVEEFQASLRRAFAPSG